jgi:hypothetical protein
VKVEWLGNSATKEIRSKVGGNLDGAAKIVQEHARYLISVPGPPRSSPGDPPHIDTSELIESVDRAADPKALSAAVGSEVDHAAYTEIGTEKMEARPWLVRALIEKAAEVARAICRP